MPDNTFGERGLKLSHSLERAQLNALRAQLQPGDTVIISEVDRLSRTLADGIALIKEWDDMKVNFRSIGDGIDLRSNAGRLQFGILLCVGEWTRRNISERTSAGMAASKRAGVRMGPKPVLRPEQLVEAQRMWDEGRAPSDIARLFTNPRTDKPISRWTIIRYCTGGSGLEQGAAVMTQYPLTVPREVPPGQVLVHNHVRPARRQGTRGFRFWLQEEADERIERCECGWAPGIAEHWRIHSRVSLK